MAERELTATYIEGLRLLGRGATADVYLMGDGSALKLFRPEFPKRVMEYEANIARAVDALGLPAPKYLGTAQVTGNGAVRRGILYECAEGPPLLEELLRLKKRRMKTVDELAAAHLALLRKQGTGLPNQRDRFAECLGRTDLSEEERSAVLSLLDSLPPGNAVCHGDYHPGNIHRAPDGLRVLDWMNAYAGNPEGDAIRTILMLESPFMPFPMSGFSRFLFMRLKRKLAHRYRRAMQRGLGFRHYRKWQTVIAAVRLSDGIEEEKRWLKEMIRIGLARSLMKRAQE